MAFAEQVGIERGQAAARGFSQGGRWHSVQDVGGEGGGLGGAVFDGVGAGEDDRGGGPTTRPRTFQFKGIACIAIEHDL